MPERLTDEILMAYADGEADPSTRREVESALRHDPALRARLQIFERTGRTLGKAFENIPMPAATIEANPEPAKRPWWRGWRLGEGFSPAFSYGLATAALVITAVAVWQALFMAETTTQPLVYIKEERLLAGGSLRNALETARSQGLSVTPDGDEPIILQTFREASGGYCREYAAGGGTFRGVACRSGAVQWHVRLHASTPEGGPTPGGYAPAGADASQLVDGFVHQIMSGEPLTVEAETEVIAGEWTAQRK